MGYNIVGCTTTVSYGPWMMSWTRLYLPAVRTFGHIFFFFFTPRLKNWQRNRERNDSYCLQGEIQEYGTCLSELQEFNQCNRHFTIVLALEENFCLWLESRTWKNREKNICTFAISQLLIWHWCKLLPQLHNVICIWI